MDNKWHYTAQNDFPKAEGDYAKQHYPQIPCLCHDKYHNDYKILYWNVTEKCWDDEDCDDYYCDKDGVERWRYLDTLIEEK